MEYTSMMNNYLQTKESYKDCILFYRLGDFYEMFFEDAEIASKILDLVLTSRGCGKNLSAPMCGVPYHAADTYIAKLVSAGKKVAICEQMSAPSKNELVRREIVRVVTPGTTMEGNVLDDKRNNFIASIFLNGQSIGVAICDITTGYFATSQFGGVSAFREMQELIFSFSPSEIIANSEAVELGRALESVKSKNIAEFTLYDDKRFENNYAKSAILNHFKISNLIGFGFDGKNFAIGAAGALLQYLKDTQKRDLPHLENIKFINSKEFMSIDIKSRKNLEITCAAKDGKRTGSLLWLLDKTVTNIGARKLSEYLERPLQDIEAINLRLDAVEELKDNFIVRDQITQLLQRIKDIERISGKIAYNIALPKDLFLLKESLLVIPEVKSKLEQLKSKKLCQLNERISSLEQATEEISKTIIDETQDFPLPSTLKNGGYIKKGVDETLDNYIDLMENGKKHISELEEYERNRTGIRTLKLGYTRVFGYYFEVSNSFKGKVPSDFIRKQTLVNGERFVSEKMKVLEERLLEAEEKRLDLERLMFEKLRDFLLPYIPDIKKTSDSIGELDCLASLAKVAMSNGFVKPTMCHSGQPLKITNGRHPVVEAFVKRDNFIANDTYLDNDENRTMIITGPNMAGKSTYMRQVALIVLMAHIGSFVPAESCEMPIVDKIFTRIGASDDLSLNQSTFMVEMTEIANILVNATRRSLLILDEVGRGTSTFDGLSIAWAIMEYISREIPAMTLFSTHFHELTELEGKIPGIKNYKITVKEHRDTLIFLHKIMRGGANKSFGIEVATLAGVPAAVCNRAKEIVKILESRNINYNVEFPAEVEDNNKQLECDAKARDLYVTIKDININKCTPMEAFEILIDLKKRIE